MGFITTIFDTFDEVKKQEDCYWFFISLGAFGSVDTHYIAWEMVCDNIQIYKSRFAQFIEDGFDNYIVQSK